MQYSRPKINNLDLLRLIAAAAIVIYHLFSRNNLYMMSVPLYATLRQMTRQGMLAPDLFFMISGFFLVYTFKPDVSLKSFIKKRILRFWPVLVFIILCNFVISWFGLFNFDIMKHLITFSGISCFGFSAKFVSIGRFWYVSSLLWVSAVLYYAMLRVDKTKIKVGVTICIIIAYTILSIMPIDYSVPTFGQMWHGIISVGMLRAIGGVGVGYMIAQWYEKCYTVAYNQNIEWKKLCFTVLEIIALLLTIRSLSVGVLGLRYSIFTIGIFVTTIMLLLAKRGWISQKLDKVNISFLSRYTYSLFMCHPFVYIVLKKLLWKPHPEIVYNEPVGNLFVTLSLVIVMTLITYHCVELPAQKWVAKRKIK